MDGLLIDSEPLWARAFKDAFKTLEVAISDEDMREIMGKRQLESIRHFYHKYAIKGYPLKDMEALIVSDMIAMVGREGKLLPGVHHAFEVCEDAGLPMAIASSSNDAIIKAVMDKLEIRSFFGHIYSAQHEPYGKPHPGVFITAAGLLNVRPELCLVFEDSPSGVLAAKAARMKCIAVPEPALREHPFIRTADVVIDSLDDFDGPMFARLQDGR